jgi:two-component system CheB/CheR fusion protein
VLALFDIDEVRRHESQTQEAKAYCEAVLDAVLQAVAILESDLTVRSVNATYCDLFQVAKADITGRSFLEQREGKWNTKELRALLDRGGPPIATLEAAEIPARVPGAPPKRIRVEARRLTATNNRPPLILLTMQESDGEAQ